MLGWLAPRCPLGTHEKAWVERRMLWLAGQFGIDRMRNAEVILPTNEFFPDQYDGDEASAQKCLDLMCRYMRIEPSTITFEILDDDQMPGAVGLYQMRERSNVCVARSQLNNPPRLLATLAHELAHELLLKGGHITREAADHEEVTDLLPVFLGLGIFAANATVEHTSVTEGNSNFFSISKNGYLSSITLGYALAVFAFVRGETSPSWASHLRMDAAATLKAGMRFLHRTGDTLFGPDSVVEQRTPTPAEVIVRLGHRSPTVRVSALWDIWDHQLSGEELLSAVLDRLNDRDGDVQHEAVRTLAVFGDSAGVAVPQLIQAAWYGAPSTRFAAIHALGAMGTNPTEVIPALTTVLGDGQPDIVCAAASALACFGRSAETAESRLLTALEGFASVNDENCMVSLVTSIRQINPDARTLIRNHFAGRDHEVLRLVLDVLREQEKVFKTE